MSWAKMIKDGLKGNLYALDELQTLKESGLQQLLDRGFITSEERVELETLIDDKILELQG